MGRPGKPHFTFDRAEELRVEYARGTISIPQLARREACGISTIGTLLLGNSYKAEEQKETLKLQIRGEMLQELRRRARGAQVSVEELVRRLLAAVLPRLDAAVERLEATQVAADLSKPQENGKKRDDGAAPPGVNSGRTVKALSVPVAAPSSSTKTTSQRQRGASTR